MLHRHNPLTNSLRGGQIMRVSKGTINTLDYIRSSDDIGDCVCVKMTSRTTAEIC